MRTHINEQHCLIKVTIEIAAISVSFPDICDVCSLRASSYLFSGALNMVSLL